MLLLLFLDRGCVMSRIVRGGFGFPSAFGIAEGWHVDVDWGKSWCSCLMCGGQLWSAPKPGDFQIRGGRNADWICTTRDQT